ncbi:hypothetical protein [Methylobacterium marchantiae]|uniref:Uncharacterized protein n=1 Tax=Methylobacterium marchantiae TaxID=600331 RepID=A0ABW3X441_9HYPH
MTLDHQFLSQARRDLERAEIARSKAETMVIAAEKDIARLQGFIEQYELYARELEKTQSTIRSRLSTRSLTDVAVSIIEKAEGPISIQAILNGLQVMGIEVGGENKSANLAAYLSKDNRVRYERGSGWMISVDALFQDASTNSSNLAQGSNFDQNLSPSTFGEVRRRYRESNAHSNPTRSNHPHASLNRDEDIPV